MKTRLLVTWLIALGLISAKWYPQLVVLHGDLEWCVTIDSATGTNWHQCSEIK